MHCVYLGLAVLASLVTAQDKEPADQLDQVDLSIGLDGQRILGINNNNNDVSANVSVVTNVKHINLYLDIPEDCHAVYNDLIVQLSSCRGGSNRGDPRLDRGCLLRLDFSRFKELCEEEEEDGIFFPAVSEAPFHPTPPCKGDYCREAGPIWPSFKPEENDVETPKVDVTEPNSTEPPKTEINIKEEVDPNNNAPRIDADLSDKLIQRNSANLWEIITNSRTNN